MWDVGVHTSSESQASQTAKFYMKQSEHQSKLLVADFWEMLTTQWYDYNLLPVCSTEVKKYRKQIHEHLPP